MRKIDAIAITFGSFVVGGVIYLILQGVGVDIIQAGIWTEAVLIAGLFIWTLTYIIRFSQGNMTYNQQLKDYQDAVLQKRLEKMTPEELEKLQAEVEAEANKKS